MYGFVKKVWALPPALTLLGDMDSGQHRRTVPNFVGSERIVGTAGGGGGDVFTETGACTIAPRPSVGPRPLTTRWRDDARTSLVAAAAAWMLQAEPAGGQVERHIG